MQIDRPATRPGPSPAGPMIRIGPARDDRAATTGPRRPACYAQATEPDRRRDAGRTRRGV